MLEFTPSEVGTHFVDVVVAGRRMSSVAKVYNSSLIRVLDVTPGVVGQTSQFKGTMNVNFDFMTNGLMIPHQLVQKFYMQKIIFV